EHVAVVSGENDQRLGRINLLVGNLDGFSDSDGVGQRTVSVAGVVSVVNTATFNHQNEAFVVLGEKIDGLRGHLGDGRLTASILGAIGLVLHVAAVEQAESLVHVGRV